MPYEKEVFGRGKENTAVGCSPLKMFEYMVAGRIILASNLPALQEIINKKNSYIIKENKIENLVKVLKEIEKDRETAIKKVGQAKEDVKRYIWNIRAKK